jgi:hypothetical protein
MWESGRIEVDAEREDVRASLQRILRSTPIAVDDPSLRSFGTSGPTMLQPGSLRWFSEAALTRAHAEGLVVRLVPTGSSVLGFDPAGLYRPFTEQWERMARLAPSPAPGEATEP